MDIMTITSIIIDILGLCLACFTLGYNLGKASK